MFRRKKEEKPCKHIWKLITKTYGEKIVNIDEGEHTHRGPIPYFSEKGSHKKTTIFSKTTLLYLCALCGKFEKIEMAGEEQKS